MNNPIKELRKIKNQIEKFLTNNLGPSQRGFTTGEIKKAINTSLNKNELFLVLKIFDDFIFTGYTKGKRWTLWKYQRIVQHNHQIDYDIRYIQCVRKLTIANPKYSNNYGSQFQRKLIEDFNKSSKKNFIQYLKTLPEFQKKTLKDL